MSERIYLDHAATTPVRPEARRAMEPYLNSELYGNPSSIHSEGRRAKRTLDDARASIATALGAEFSEITFTSGGTEADNAAIVGVMLANKDRGNHLVTTQIEHEAILQSCIFLQNLGVKTTYLAPDKFGRNSPDQVAAALTDSTVLVSVMHANNEVGTVQPIAEIARVAHARGVYMHSDAVQTFGQLPVDVNSLGVDLLSVSAHKIYGPKGVGALYAREGVPIVPLLHGGPQERERRAGTENVGGIAGFAIATTLIKAERETIAKRMTTLRDRLIAQLIGKVPGAILNGHPTERLSNNVNISFPGLDPEAVLLSLDRSGVSASSGSACTSGSIEPSHVLLAMGFDDARARSAIRFTLGRATTESEIDRAAQIMIDIARRMMAVRNH